VLTWHLREDKQETVHLTLRSRLTLDEASALSRQSLERTADRIHQIFSRSHNRSTNGEGSEGFDRGFRQSPNAFRAITAQASEHTHFASQIDKTNRFPKKVFIQIARPAEFVCMKSLAENSVLTPRRANTTVIPCAGVILLYLLGCICAFQIRSLGGAQYPIHLGCTGGFFSREVIATAKVSDSYLWLTSSPGLLRFDGLRFVKWKTVPAYLAFEPGPSRARFQKRGEKTRSTHDERA
jgi:hypothetical protein